jgi:staphylococcal nuclease homologue
MLVNQELLEKGYAREYTYKSDYSKQAEFRQAATQAKQQKL